MQWELLREKNRGCNRRRIPLFLFALIPLELRLDLADPADGWLWLKKIKLKKKREKKEKKKREANHFITKQYFLSGLKLHSVQLSVLGEKKSAPDLEQSRLLISNYVFMYVLSMLYLYSLKLRCILNLKIKMRFWIVSEKNKLFPELIQLLWSLPCNKWKFS